MEKRKLSARQKSQVAASKRAAAEFNLAAALFEVVHTAINEARGL